MARLSDDLEARLIRLGQRLVDQAAARIIVPARRAEPGFWFGGGNMMIRGDGSLDLVGRYRDHGDSRTGTAAGPRGWRLSIFRSTDGGESFQEYLAFNKADLDLKDRKVLSIEGSALRQADGQIQLFVSTEKDGIGYPDVLAGYLKPGTGVWTIERYVAANIEELREATAETVVESRDPCHLHVKDPAVHRGRGVDHLIYCTHPFSWSSSNSAVAVLSADGRPGPSDVDFFPRGTTWDVAISRITAAVDLPSTQAFGDRRVTLIFYDGGECLRDHQQHAQAQHRPRGFSCEELGGLAYCLDDDWRYAFRLSALLPLFVSPHGTGCSRYVDVLPTADQWLVSWQQAQADGSQPLVLHRLPAAEVNAILNGA